MTTGGFSSTAAAAAFAAADRLHAAGRWCEARAGFADVLAEAVDAGGDLTPAEQVAAERLADLSALCGQPRVAIDVLAGLAETNRGRGKPFLADYFTLKQADAALGAGDYPAVLAAVRKLQPRTGPVDEVPTDPAALPGWEAGCRWVVRGPSDRAILFSRLYLALGGWLAGNGYYRHAAVLLRHADRHTRPPAPPLACRAWVRVRLALAAALTESGELAEAGKVLAGAAPAIDRAEHPGWWVEWLGLAAQTALLAGRYGDALRRLDEVAAVCRDGRFAAAAVTALIHRARVLVSFNQVLAAERALDEAERLREDGPDPADAVRIEWLRRLARHRGDSPFGDGPSLTVHAIWNEPDAPGPNPLAPAPSQDPLDLPAADNYLAFFEDRALAVRWRLANGRVADAVDLMATLWQRFAPCDSVLVRARLTVLEGLTRYTAGDVDGAEAMFAEAAPAFEARGLVPERRDALRGQWWCEQRKNGPPPGPGSADRAAAPSRKATDTGVRVRELTDTIADSLSATDRALWLLDKWGDEERVLGGQVVALEKARDAAARAPWWRRWWLRRDVRAGLADYLERLDHHRRREAWRAAGVGERGDGPTAADPPQADRDRVALVFLVLPEFTYVARVGRGVFDARPVPLTRVRARELTAKWHERVGGNAFADPTTLADELAEALKLAELVGDLPRRVTRLTVVADDALHGFPFAALRVDGRYLVERFALSVRSDVAPVPRPRADVETGLVVAVSHGAPPSDTFPEGVKPLDGVRPEAAIVSRRLEAAGVRRTERIGGQLTAAGVLTDWAAAGVVHMACHGVFVPDDPGLSGLVVVDGDGRAEVLSLRDLFAADLRRVEHVTLSACWGGDNFVLPGRRILSLPDAISRAGAGSVLAALWRVDDEVGREFADRFLQHARTCPRDEAVRRTQCDFLAGRVRVPDPNAPGGVLPVDRPYFWAGYRLHGDPGPIRWPADRPTHTGGRRWRPTPTG